MIEDITYWRRIVPTRNFVRVDMAETVDHPAHYNKHPSGVECITVVEWFSFNIGNAIKYLWRADHKNGLEDLKKARWYVDREIQRLEKK